MIDLSGGPVSGGGSKRASGGSRSGGAAAADAKKPRAASGCSPEASYSERLDFDDPEVSARARSLQTCESEADVALSGRVVLEACLKYVPR